MASVIKKTTIRLYDDEKGSSVLELLKNETAHLSDNDRLIENIYYAELLRKEYGYISMSEILIKLLTNKVNISNTTNSEELIIKKSDIDVTKIENMLGGL